MLVFKHPKYYEEMRKRARAHQKELQASHVKKAISPKQSTDSGGRAPAYVWYFQDHKWKQRYDPKAKADKPTSSQADKPTSSQADKPASPQASSGSRINKRSI